MPKQTWSATVYGGSATDATTRQNRAEFMHKYGRCRNIPPPKWLLMEAYKCQDMKHARRSELV